MTQHKDSIDFGLTDNDWMALGAPMAHRLNEKVMNRLHKLEERSDETDPQVLALPHPQRTKYMRHLEIQEIIYGEDWPAMREVIANTNLPLVDTVHKLADISRTFKMMYRAMLHDPSGINAGSLGGTILALRHQISHGAMFQTTDELDDMLANTDIADDIPIGMIKAPFPACYFEFGEHRSSPLKVWNETTGNHIAEGCYLFEYQIDNFRGTPAPMHRHLLLIQTGSPKASIGDDAIQLFTIPILDEGASINETIDEYIRIHKDEVLEAQAEDPGTLIKQARDEMFEQAKVFLKHILKIILYLSTDDHTQRRVTEGTDGLKALAAIKSTAKRAKAERKLDKAYDRIVLGAKKSPSSDGIKSDPTGRKISKVFWRRGHFRNQRFGEGLKDRKHIWIKPTLVQGDALSDGAATQPKNYKIN